MLELTGTSEVVESERIHYREGKANIREAFEDGPDQVTSARARKVGAV